jgi:hypothetical protein
MSKRTSPPDERPPPNFDQVWREFERVAGGLGYSLDRSADALKLAFWLFVYLRETRQRGNGRAGRKATEAIKDAIILALVELAKQRDGDERAVKQIIRGIASANGWPTTDEEIETRRRRYYDAKRRGSPINRRMVEALQPLLPHLKRRAEQLEELERAGLSPAEIEVVMDRIGPRS